MVNRFLLDLSLKVEGVWESGSSHDGQGTGVFVWGKRRLRGDWGRSSCALRREMEQCHTARVRVCQALRKALLSAQNWTFLSGLLCYKCRIRKCRGIFSVCPWTSSKTWVWSTPLRSILQPRVQALSGLESSLH